MSKSNGKPMSMNVPFKIEKGVPIPPRRGRQSKYPVAELGSGESFLVPVGAFKKPQSVVSTLYAAAKRSGVKVSVRIMDDGVRVWRIK
jgi:hypothetical protein